MVVSVDPSRRLARSWRQFGLLGTLDTSDFNPLLWESMMDLIDRLRDLAARVSPQLERLETEEATKTALVLPFLNALGYDVFNPLEVVPEFTADVGIKRGEKVTVDVPVTCGDGSGRVVGNTCDRDPRRCGRRPSHHSQALADGDRDAAEAGTPQIHR